MDTKLPIAEQPPIEPAVRAWGPWWRTVLGELLRPHFVITVLILIIWAWAIYGPIWAISALAERMAQSPTEEILKAASDGMTALVSAAGAISGLFTAVLGLVLGHYFGQRTGVAIAREERLDKEHQVAALSHEASELTHRVADRKSESDDALQQALSLLPETVAIPPDSPLARYLKLADDEAPDDQDESETGN